VLGLIPGVGAIYNGQYAKGLIHVMILGLLISITQSNISDGAEVMFGLMIPVWSFYMAFEAYHTARRRQLGEAVDEFSGLMSIRRRSSGFPAGPILLIGIGVLFLLHNLDLLRFYQIFRYWPVFLIALGVYLLVERLNDGASVSQREVGDERR
jgi:hypothetical protein